MTEAISLAGTGGRESPQCTHRNHLPSSFTLPPRLFSTLPPPLSSPPPPPLSPPPPPALPRPPTLLLHPLPATLFFSTLAPVLRREGRVRGLSGGADTLVRHAAMYSSMRISAKQD